MSTFNLLDTAKAYFNNALVNKAANALGESEHGISKALNAIIPSVISGLADKASTTQGAAEVVQMAAEQHRAGILDTISGFFHNENMSAMIANGGGLINSIFGTGGKSNMLTSLISNFSGIKTSSTGALMSMAVPTILGILGKHNAINEISTNRISSVLESQKSNALDMLPSGFNLSSLGNTAANSTGYKSKVVDDMQMTRKKKGGIMNWLTPLLLLLLLGAAAYFLLGKSCNKTENAGNPLLTDSTVNSKTRTVTLPKGMLDSISGDFIYNEGDTITISLPNGGELKVGKYSTEANLVNFLNDKNALLDSEKGNWFEFTNVHFKTGSSDLTDVSSTQLQNMVAIAKAYPNAMFRFGGYTDNTGDSLVNISLSQKRADAVNEMARKFGAPASSLIDAKGFGEQWPIADNATPEGRAMNRRVAVNVKAK